MRCCVCFDVQFDVNVPKEEIQKILQSNVSNLDKGSFFVDLITKTNNWIVPALDLADGVEITTIISQDPEIEEIPETIWEG